MIKKVETYQVMRGWKFRIVCDGGSVIIYTDAVHYTTEREAVQAGFQWLREDAHSRICNSNAIELP